MKQLGTARIQASNVGVDMKKVRHQNVKVPDGIHPSDVLLSDPQRRHVHTFLGWHGLGRKSDLRRRHVLVRGRSG